MLQYENGIVLPNKINVCNGNRMKEEWIRTFRSRGIGHSYQESWMIPENEIRPKECHTRAWDRGVVAAVRSAVPIQW